MRRRIPSPLQQPETSHGDKSHHTDAEISPGEGISVSKLLKSERSLSGKEYLDTVFWKFRTLRYDSITNK